MKKLFLFLFLFACNSNPTYPWYKGSLEELKTLPLPFDKILVLHDYLQYNDLENIYDLKFSDNINIKDLHNIKPYVMIGNDDNVKDVYFRVLQLT